MYDKNICIVDGCDRLRDKKQNRKICQMHRGRMSKYKSYDLPTAPKLPDGILKTCKNHGELNALQVYKRTPNKNWLSCRLCCKERNDRFNVNNPSGVRNAYKKNYYLTKDGTKISKEYYLLLIEKQNGLCAICKQEERISISPKNDKAKRLAIDHCHKTGKIRGLLCHKCNVSIGALNESIETLQSAINYLQQHQ
ncbi:Recombination endonuclease VII [uncultured Caudovirales phage]|uniref:Recombination endonuclease VII n=1 Tax=uncultured Caudovirales phage TaxID=2100421 RepID=A0A6J5MX61_9CAUD|nr:Recombination endonuclease VII [uncultured Caudovirales phage]CAB4157334.1 Recombination endonuclease VII [uncultured Caudovirales phage]CAB5225475.1 Recombination endonuclease VII [uncultured Caudovirales phage]